MKKTVKKLTAAGLTLTSVMSLMACGNSPSAGQSANNPEVTKPEKIKVMMNGTVVTEANGGMDFRKQLTDALGMEIEWVQPDHSGYFDALSQAFNSEDTMPDVCILSSEYYALYAANGFLWNMTDAWQNSETKKSGRLIDTADNVLSALMVNGEDGKKGMYGFSPYRGNGCITYVKASWLKRAGIDVSTVEGKTLTFNQYYDMLKKLSDSSGHYAISSAGFVGTGAPYTHYLPEFYQDANYTFYEDSTGKYVDGFSQDSMKKALERIAKGVADGIIDKESVNNSTSNARDKFRSTNSDADSGVFTYWAGAWKVTLEGYLESAGLESELIALNPIQELGKYVERISPCWAITTQAQNPEGIFKYFIDTMLDGGEIQTLWTYGAKGTHWNDIAETVTVEGASEGQTYKAGEFHLLPSPEKPTTLQAYNHIDPLLSLGTFTNGNPGENQISKDAQKNEELFAQNSQVAMPVPMTEAFGDNIGDINKTRNYVIAQVCLGYMSVDEGMKYYNDNSGELVEQVLKSLNK